MEPIAADSRVMPWIQDQSGTRCNSGGLRIEARIDFDGDPMTHDPAEPRAAVVGVTKGTSGVRLVLKRGSN